MSTDDRHGSPAAATAVAATDRPPRSRRRRGIAVVLAVLTLTAMGAGGAWVFSGGASGAAAGVAEKTPPATEAVQQGVLEGNTTTVGTLRYSELRTIQSASAGTVTALPAEGSVISLGGRLYSVNNVPVFVFRGGLPSWRTLESGMDNGPDVRQLETSLRDLGHFSGEPDDRFSWATVEAIKAWQKSNDLEETGDLPLGSLVFAPGDLRIGAVTAQVGDLVSVGTEMFVATSTTQIVETNIPLADQQLAVIGAAVRIRLPGGSTSTGVIQSVGTPTEVDGATGEKQTVIPTVVTLDDASAAAAFQEAAVSVDIPSDRRENVLSVPVGALLAITPDQFGVEVVESDGTTRQVPVVPGLFAGGRVEISGEGLDAGTLVVVPRR